MKSLVWLRSDLRLDDNPAMRNAFTQSKSVHVLYLYSKRQLKLHNESNIKISFLIENLKDLENSLDKYQNLIKLNNLIEKKFHKNFKDISEEVLSEENTDHDENEENNIKEENKNEEKQGKIKMVLVYFVVVIISLLGLILLLDTFKSYLISEFPTITPLFDSFYETFLDFKLFVKDLAN